MWIAFAGVRLNIRITIAKKLASAPMSMQVAVIGLQYGRT